MLTNYSPPSHKLTFLRSLAEDQDRRLLEAWPREQQRHRAWFNTLNEAYVKARYSKHFLISEEALLWLVERTTELQKRTDEICREHLEKMKKAASGEAPLDAISWMDEHLPQANPAVPNRTMS